MKPFLRRTLLLAVPLIVGGAALAATSRLTRAAQADLLPSDAPTRLAAEPMAEAARDERAVALLNAFVRALQAPDEAARIAAALPLLHRSLLSDNGKDIEATTKKFAWKKAVQNADHYATPVEVARVRAKGTLTLGEGDNPEKGRADDYFIGKKAGVSGLPASITIFFPVDGAPKILYFGGL